MLAFSLESTFVLSKDAIVRDLDGEAVVLDLDSGTYFGLNPVGTRIWQLIERHGRLQTVLDQLCREYHAPQEEVERDLLTLIEQLVQARLGKVQSPR